MLWRSSVEAKIEFFTLEKKGLAFKAQRLCVPLNSRLESYREEREEKR